jgi:glyceraldehyde-3-phosphate dehydrogenase/erythrose-4-phosphate dehydrogenase
VSIRIAINGFGRIGRAILKLALDEPALEVVAVNDLADVENLAYLLRFDTVYGRYPPVCTIERRRHRHRRAWRERCRKHIRHHLLRELHDELHHADR